MLFMGFGRISWDRMVCPTFHGKCGHPNGVFNDDAYTYGKLARKSCRLSNQPNVNLAGDLITNTVCRLLGTLNVRSTSGSIVESQPTCTNQSVVTMEYQLYCTGPALPIWEWIEKVFVGRASQSLMTGY
jgi:hypothetical protein